MARGGRRIGAGRKKIVASDLDVFCAVEKHLNELRPEYESRWEEAVLKAWSRGAWEVIGGDGETSLSDAVNAIPAATGKIIVEAHNALESDSIDAAEKILDAAECNDLIDSDQREAIIEGWSYLRQKPIGHKAPTRQQVKGPTGEPVLELPRGLLKSATEAAAAELGLSAKRAREIWTATKWRIFQDLRNYKPDPQ